MASFSIGDAYFKYSTDARVSLHGFLAASVAAAAPPLLICPSGWPLWQRLLCGSASAGLVAGLLRLLLPVRAFPSYWENGKRALLLGWAFGSGAVLTVGSPHYWTFGLYTCYLSMFHWSEYYVTAVTNPSTLRLSSYMLDHSTEYHIAAAFSWLEFWAEAWLLPDMKAFTLPIAAGIALCTAGECLRKLAMLTAGTNFNHVLEHRKRSDHVLVTRGVYALVRHPAYTGWFIWAVGTQLLLCNPVAAVGYTVASWRFFRERILEEERLLINFFNQDYLTYQRSTWSGIPFVRGYILHV